MDESEEINFSALDKIPQSHSLLERLDKVALVLIISSIITAVGYAYYVKPDSTTDMFQIIFTVVVLITAVIFFQVIIKLIWALSVERKIPGVLTDFANTNGFTYSKDAEVGEQYASMFRELSGHTFKNSIKGNLVGYDFQVVDCTYEAPVGNGTILSTVRMLQVQLPKSLPNVAIKCEVESDYSRQNDTMYGVETIFGEDFHGVDIPTQFSEYFTAFASGKQAEHFLQKITSSLLHKLRDLEALCDIEIAENTINFYWDDLTMSRQNYEDIFVIGTSIVSEFDQENTSTFSTQHNELAVVEKTIHTNNANKTALLGIMIMAGVFTGVAFFSTSTKSQIVVGENYAITMIGFIAAILLASGVIIIRKNKRAKTLKDKYHKDQR